MNTIIFLFSLTTTFLLAVAEKQLQLEDIERETLANERNLNKNDKQPPAKYQLPIPAQQPLPAKILPQSQLEYGFTPLKSTQKYIQQPRRQQQQQQIEIPQTFQYVYPQLPTPLTYQQFPQYPQYPQYQYQQYDNVPYVVDNQLLQSAKIDQQQQYYGQQLLYLQPAISSTSNIQMIVDPKGNVKYYMHVPNQYYSEVKNDEDPIKSIKVQTTPQSYHDVGPQIFTREPDYRQLPRSESQYITQPQLPPQPVTQPVQYVSAIQPTPAAVPLSIQSTQQPFVASQQLIQPADSAKSQYVPKGNPQSLLDSYVPSILQLQYYKRQQEAQTNSLLGENPKSVAEKNLPTRQTLRLPNAEIETSRYNFGLPSPYRSQNFKN